TFRQSDGGNGTFVAAPNVSYGPAGAVTGIISEIQGYGGDSTAALSNLAKVAITAAIKADKKHSLEIAQAAAQAAQFVFQLTTSTMTAITFESDIVAAVLAGNPAATGIANAVHFGVTE